MPPSAILRSPLLRFLLAGALLFGLREIAGDGGSVAPGGGESERAGDGGRPNTPPSDEALLLEEALARGLDVGDEAIETWLVEKMLFLDEAASPANRSALVAEARALGLDRDDVIVERILVEKLIRLETEPLADERPGDADLARAYAARRASLTREERRTLVHRFFSRDLRGAAAEQDAVRAGARLRDASTRLEAQDPSEGAQQDDLGDPFPLGPRFASRTEAELARELGADFARAVFAQGVGRWSPPLASAYGFHLVRVEAIAADDAPSFEAVRERLRLELEEAIRVRKREALLRALRTRYEVARARAHAEERP